MQKCNNAKLQEYKNAKLANMANMTEATTKFLNSKHF